MKAVDDLETKPQSSIWIIALLLNLIIGVIDYLTGYEVRVEVFYLIPICLTSWFINRNAGFLMSVISATTTMCINIPFGQIIGNYLIYFWNILVYFVFFLVVAHLVSKEKIVLDQNRRSITELKRTEKEFRRSEELYRNLVENINEIIYEIDENGKVTYISHVDLLRGYEPSDILGRPFFDFIHHEDRPRVLQKYQEIMHGPVPVLEFRAVLKSGGSLWVQSSNRAIIEEGTFKGLRGILMDIDDRKRMETERRGLEERLNRAEKMQALGNMAGGVAHDLNNVLGVLVGYSELLLMEIPEGNPLRRHVSMILQSSQRAAAVIEDLLTLTRRGVAVSEVISLNKVISDYFKTPEFEKLKVHHPYVILKTELQQDLLNIKGSPVHLGKTIMNLVSNATEAVSDSGEVTVKTRNLYIDKYIKGYDEVKQGDYVVLTVSDNGRGISPQDIGKIFEPFYTKKVMGRSGTGLGLAVVWGTVKDHNGYIDVQSEEGKGTTFTIYFPLTREELAGDQPLIPISEYMGNDESILVVDDVEGQRELAVQMLKKLNYAVATVSSGEGAVKYLKQNKVDLIILDMIMDPGIDGLETYERILKINPEQKAIIVSGYSETERVKEAQKLGAGTYVRKPYILERIGLAVRRELDR
jgi:PAS domain S-box-containing protein